MKYDYQYDIACIISATFLLVLFLIRRTYKTKSNQILFLLIFNNILSALLDILSVLSIYHPERYPMWFNYLTATGCIFFYNMMGVLFFAYVDSKTKIPVMLKATKYICLSVMLLELTLVATTPWTHLICYFDEGSVYHRGPLMTGLYVIAGVMLIGSFLLFCIARRRFNKYQTFAIAAFASAVFIGAMIQMLYPKLLVGEFSCTLVLYFIYSAMENPVYYAYKDTNCLNRRSFLETVKRMVRNNQPMSLVAFSIRDYAYVKQTLSLKNQDRLSSNIAEFVQYNFGPQGYCIADDKFVIVMDDADDLDFVKKKIYGSSSACVK